MCRSAYATPSSSFERVMKSARAFTDAPLAAAAQSGSGHDTCAPSIGMMFMMLPPRGCIIADPETPVADDAHPANEDDLDGLVSANNYMAGYQAGKALCEAIGGKGEVAFIDYYIKDYTVSQRDQGYYDALAEYPDVELVYEEVAKGSADTALPSARMTWASPLPSR